jgi:hypothetical protein
MADAADIPEVDLSEPKLLAAACETSGLSDWGDESFRTPLKIYLEAIEATTNLHHLGRFLFYRTTLRLLTNRLKMERDVQADPEILETPIPRPLFILGLPRTGTTLLHTLLACDPNARALRLWEGMFPTPPPHPDSWSGDL